MNTRSNTRIRAKLPVLFGLLLTALTAPSSAATFQVTNTNDSGAGSLRRAINDANGNSGSDTIEISATGTVNLLTALPSVSDEVHLDGPGADLFTVRRDDGASNFRIFDIDEDATIDDMTISNGNASNGGGIITSAYLTLKRCVVSDNTALVLGGGIFVESDPAAGCLVNHCALLNNTASGEGAALEHRGGHALGAEVRNTTVALNGATSGTAGSLRALSIGGMVVQLTVRSCTITDNTISGIKSAGADATVSIQNTILSNNTDGAIGSSNGTLLSNGNNLVRSNENAESLFPAGIPNVNGDLVGTATNPFDPQFLPLSLYGGGTPCYALRSDSPAIDSGFDTVSRDQRYLPREEDGNGDGVSATDVGAYEVQEFSVTSLANAGADTLRQAILDSNANGPGLIRIKTCGTISLLDVLPDLTQDVKLSGPGAYCSEITRDNASSTNFGIFDVKQGVQLTLSGVTISNGFAVDGGAINVEGHLEMDSCVLQFNRAVFLGGAVAASDTGSFLITNTSLVDNLTLSSDGGAISYIQNSVPDVQSKLLQCTISGNTAGLQGTGQGGGISATGTHGFLEITHCTITDNTADLGGGINAQSGTLLMAETIVADNTGSAEPDITIAGALFFSSGGNIVGVNTGIEPEFPAGMPSIGGNYVGTATSPVDPELGVLGDHGGPTPTHVPAFDSIAIDNTFTNSLVLPTTDQRGRPRTLDGNCDTIEKRDIGAVEYRDCRGGNVNAAGLSLVFAGDMENGSGNFTTFSPTGNGDWVILATTEACSPGSAWFSSDLPTVKDDHLEALPVQLPATPALLKFNQTYHLESGFDGAVIEISADGGAFQDLENLITTGLYDRRMSSTTSSPIGGQMAWTGTGTPCDEVIVDLADFAGSEVVIRFRLTCDSSVEIGGGWSVDDLRVCDRVGSTIQNVLFVNGSAGSSPDRRVSVGTNLPITVEMQASEAGPASARYFLYVWLGDSSSSVPFQASGINFGTLVNPGPLQGGGPQPYRCLRSAGIPAGVCSGVQEITAPANAPFTVTSNNGIGNPNAKFTLQGMIEDFGSENSLPFSVTNAVIFELF